ncbi:hypothetical protein JKP88DRAFT_352655 [Tribonema minus]|uniref:Uncharacterized protein n=1 Tax=Tribonema minus TaxID=303371 RepID=A0A835ZKB6_9STRA|nr:hypothetical protein JKP88DRAFT_352655 [Tribonema minus]
MHQRSGVKGSTAVTALLGTAALCGGAVYFFVKQVTDQKDWGAAQEQLLENPIITLDFDAKKRGSSGGASKQRLRQLCSGSATLRQQRLVVNMSLKLLKAITLLRTGRDAPVIHALPFVSSPIAAMSPPRRSARRRGGGSRDSSSSNSSGGDSDFRPDLSLSFEMELAMMAADALSCAPDSSSNGVCSDGHGQRNRSRVGAPRRPRLVVLRRDSSHSPPPPPPPLSPPPLSPLLPPPLRDAVAQTDGDGAPSKVEVEVAAAAERCSVAVQCSAPPPPQHAATQASLMVDSEQQTEPPRGVAALPPPAAPPFRLLPVEGMTEGQGEAGGVRMMREVQASTQLSPQRLHVRVGGERGVRDADRGQARTAWQVLSGVGTQGEGRAQGVGDGGLWGHRGGDRGFDAVWKGLQWLDGDMAGLARAAHALDARWAADALRLQALHSEAQAEAAAATQQLASHAQPPPPPPPQQPSAAATAAAGGGAQPAAAAAAAEAQLVAARVLLQQLEMQLCAPLPPPPPPAPLRSSPRRGRAPASADVPATRGADADAGGSKAEATRRYQRGSDMAQALTAALGAAAANGHGEGTGAVKALAACGGVRGCLP